MKEDLNQLNEEVVASRQVEELVTSTTWERYIQPLIDEMITDTIGGKKKNRWVGPSMEFIKSCDVNNESRITEEDVRYLLGYRAALIDFNNNLYDIVDGGREGAEKIKNVIRYRQLHNSEYEGYETSPYNLQGDG